MLAIIGPFLAERLGKWGGLAAEAALIALAALAFYGWGWRDGRDHESERRDKIESAAKVKAQKRADDAAASDATAAPAITKAITDRRKEWDDATAKLPDQALSDRQRARACVELRRAGRPCPDTASAGNAGARPDG